ncbi:PHB domain-containing protein [Meloidogyne graminicola]|uniref:PHB domain-containing protein n=1 Tax=Meloidogyne graminicola TaxID=189291 RepID=A0A8S9ZX91_9BILA|nr:PHB domain-containing protein [Meloidogyne graminicola]
MISLKPRTVISALAILPSTSFYLTPPSLCYTSCHFASNTILNFVPQQEAWVIERMGRYLKTLKPGFNFLWPIIDSVKYVQPLKEIAMEIPEQSAITLDNVQLTLDGVLYVRIVDPYKASYGVEDPEFAVKQLAQTTMRSEVGKIILDTVFKEREQLNIAIVEAINKAAEPWGIVCLRYEIRDMQMPHKIQEAMQMQVEAERKKRAAILESEGQRDAAINIAEGNKRSCILASEAKMQEQINAATGIAKSILLEAEARQKALNHIAKALNEEKGRDAANLLVAEKSVNAFEKLAKQNNTLIMPSDLSPINSLVIQAMSVYKQLSATPKTSDVEEKPKK